MNGHVTGRKYRVFSDEITSHCQRTMCVSGVAKILGQSESCQRLPECELCAVSKVKVNDPLLLAEYAVSSAAHLGILQL
jgi:hypothetical protein